MQRLPGAPSYGKDTVGDRIKNDDEDEDEDNDQQEMQQQKKKQRGRKKGKGRKNKNNNGKGRKNKKNGGGGGSGSGNDQWQDAYGPYPVVSPGKCLNKNLFVWKKGGCDANGLAWPSMSGIDKKVNAGILVNACAKNYVVGLRDSLPLRFLPSQFWVNYPYLPAKRVFVSLFLGGVGKGVYSLLTRAYVTATVDL